MSFGFRSRDNGRTFPGVTVQPGDYFGTDPNESSATSSPGSVSYDKLQVSSFLSSVRIWGKLMVTNNLH